MNIDGLMLHCDSKKFTVTLNGKEVSPQEMGWCGLYICTGTPYKIDCTFKDKPVSLKICKKSIDDDFKKMMNDESNRD